MRVLIIGLGSIAQKHIEALNKISNTIEIFALRREDSSHYTHQGVIDIYELKDNLKFDFIIISNPTSEHGNTIKSLKNLNVPLFIEKPVFNTSGYDDVVNDVLSRNIQTYVACNLRFFDSLIFLKSVIGEKNVNEVNVYCGSYLPDWRPEVDFRTVYSANKELGGGVHIDLIHEIDYLIYLFKFPNKIRKTFKSNSSLNISAYDYANYLFEYDNFCANVILNYFRRTPKRTLEVVCSDGEYEVNLLNNTVKWNGEIIYSSSQRIKDTYLPQMQYFINNLLLEESIDKFNDIDEAYKILKICLED